ncbi:MAG: nucleotidyltransferase domain-containing protein, partial [Sedimentisphaerales bacterium]|nr:nucleotidyltransferase domain-containing protein [Sedimentisphaerales bacterium]
MKDKYLQAVIKILADNPRVERALLFGSRAMGTYTPDSGVDIALFGDELTISDHGQLANLISEQTMPQQVDIL